MEGVLNIDKPLEWTSHDVVARVRRTADMRRVGHTGTLDPLATGVLVICLGRATRLAEYVVGRPKTYEATVCLGQTSNTYDGEGEITPARPIPNLTMAQLSDSLEPFRGDIQQLPPMYSAVKKDGERLYMLARRGEEVEREPRPVTIYELALTEWAKPYARLRIRCAAGTYIRSLAHDWGQALGCGGYLTQLRRTAVGAFTAAESIPLDQLSADNIGRHLQPAETAVAHLPLLSLTAEQTNDLSHGRFIAHQPDHPADALARVQDHHGDFLGIAVRQADEWRPKKMFT